MKHLIFPAITGWRVTGGAPSLGLWSRPYVCVGVGKRGDMLLNGRFQCGMKEDVVWGCAVQCRPRIQANLNITPKAVSQHPCSCLWYPFCIDRSHWLRIQVQLSWNLRVCQRKQMGDLANSRLLPGFCLGFGLNPRSLELQVHDSCVTAAKWVDFIPPFCNKPYERDGKRQC